MKKTVSLFLLFIMGFMLTGCEMPEEEDDIPKTYERTLFASDCCQAATDLGDGWVPVWCDEFDGETVDLDKWNVEEGSGYPNNELQAYSSNNVFLEDGKLVLEARKENLYDMEYTSGRVNTQLKGDWLYGRMIIRAKMPHGRGTLPGFWMMPTEETYGAWPKSGEIDIMEYVGYDPNKIYGSFHTEKYNHLKGNQPTASLLWTMVEEVFVNYEMIWEPGSIQLFVDGEPLLSYSYVPEDNQNVPYHQAWPFDIPFFLLLCLSIGGNWGGLEGVDDNIFPTRTEIDYVRFYQRDYSYVDRDIPQSIDTIIKSTGMYKSMFYWDIPEEDYSINHYEIYIDGNLHGTTNVNSYLLTGHFPRTMYRLNVVAVDMAGNKSEPIDIEYSYG